MYAEEVGWKKTKGYSNSQVKKQTEYAIKNKIKD